MTPGQVLVCAADHIAKVGLLKNSLGDVVNGTGPCCAIGALMYCDRGDEVWPSSENRVVAVLRDGGGWYYGLASWNDMPLRTSEEVQALLRAAAVTP